MAAIFQNVTRAILPLVAWNTTFVSPPMATNSPPNPLPPYSQANDTSSMENITFGVVAILMALGGIVIGYLQLAHLRNSGQRDSDLEAGTAPEDEDIDLEEVELGVCMPAIF